MLYEQLKHRLKRKENFLEMMSLKIKIHYTIPMESFTLSLDLFLPIKILSLYYREESKICFVCVDGLSYVLLSDK